jgi:hypothetical protein
LLDSVMESPSGMILTVAFDRCGGGEAESESEPEPQDVTAPITMARQARKQIEQDVGRGLGMIRRQ